MKVVINRKFLLLGLFAILTSALISFLVEEGEFRAALKKAESSISNSIVDHDDLSTQNAINHLQSEYARQIRIQTLDRRNFNSAGISEDACFMSQKSEMTYLGLHVATIQSCADFRRAIANGFASKIFFLVFSVIQLFGLIYLLASKSATEQNLLKLILDLESSKSVKLDFTNKDLLFSKLRQIIKDREFANQRASEAQLKVESEMLISEISRKVAHDIRSPITALNFAVASANNLDENLKGLLVAAAQRISSIANDLLDSSRAARTPISFNPIDSLRLLADEFQNSSNIIVDQNSRTDLELWCEKTKFERMIANIVQNSIDAASREIAMTIQKADHFCEIVITDEGGGFDERVLKNLGKPGLSVGKKDGNGIGLSSAFTFMKELGGRLEISNTNRGARVSLHFPT